MLELGRKKGGRIHAPAFSFSPKIFGKPDPQMLTKSLIGEFASH
jgi:hypothetical protein